MNYWALKNDMIHQNWKDCPCAACCYFYLKKIKKTRIRKENFFLYWLAFVCSDSKDTNKNRQLIYNKDLKRDWSYILDLLFKILPEEDRKRIEVYFKKPDNPEHYRIVSRLDKKIHLQTLISEKKWNEFWKRWKSSTRRNLERQMLIPFLISYKKYNDDQCSDPFFHPEDYYYGFHKIIMNMIKLTQKVIDYLYDNKEEIEQRRLQRAFSKKRCQLLPVLDLLETKEIIKWNKIKKTISMHPNFKNNLRSFSSSVKSYRKKLERIQRFQPFQLR